ncbi:cell wall protein [Streptomyces paludis]|uniref:Cell wall protein n=1 Tax=Streptomyces paludis TaxID=2282738 RepID=A0A345HTC0_9ACTN|nr:cell wall protein [Streptomyces paludis]AXG79944.1 cell wall protein [Streptomyces paludis]
MSVARRPLLTATAAGTLLGALWFVPSANATGAPEEPRQRSAPSAQSLGLQSYEVSTTAGASEKPITSTDSDDPPAAPGAEVQGQPEEPEPEPSVQPVLADTGAIETTPYVVGGTVCLAIGAGFVTYSIRRGAREF